MCGKVCLALTETKWPPLPPLARPIGYVQGAIPQFVLSLKSPLLSQLFIFKVHQEILYILQAGTDPSPPEAAPQNRDLEDCLCAMQPLRRTRL